MLSGAYTPGAQMTLTESWILSLFWIELPEGSAECDMLPAEPTPLDCCGDCPIIDPCKNATCSRDCGDEDNIDGAPSLCGWDIHTMECRTGFNTTPAESEALHESAPGDCSHRTIAPTGVPTGAPSTGIASSNADGNKSDASLLAMYCAIAGVGVIIIIVVVVGVVLYRRGPADAAVQDNQARPPAYPILNAACRPPQGDGMQRQSSSASSSAYEEVAGQGPMPAADWTLGRAAYSQTQLDGTHRTYAAAADADADATASPGKCSYSSGGDRFCQREHGVFAAVPVAHLRGQRMHRAEIFVGNVLRRPHGQRHLRWSWHPAVARAGVRRSRRARRHALRPLPQHGVRPPWLPSMAAEMTRQRTCTSPRCSTTGSSRPWFTSTPIKKQSDACPLLVYCFEGLGVPC